MKRKKLAVAVVVSSLVIPLAMWLGSRFAFAQGTGETSEGVGPVEQSSGPVPQYTGEEQSSILLQESGEYIFPIDLSEEQWRERLSEDQFQTLRRHRTERAYTGRYDGVFEEGIYYSAASGQPLFRSEDKYESNTGWPSYTRPISPDAVYYRIDTSFFGTRIEVIDSLSGSHLGHVFEDGPEPTGLRYCMNSAAMVFIPYSDDPPENLYDWEGIVEDEVFERVIRPALSAR